jgi:hypothetical protein
VSLSLPLTVAGEDRGGSPQSTVGNPELAVSRLVFAESRNALLAARAALIRAQESERAARASVEIALADEIFDAWYAVRDQALARKALVLAEQAADYSNNDAQARLLRRSRLQATRTLLQSERALGEVDPLILEQVDPLYAEMAQQLPVLIGELPDSGSVPEDSADIAAQRLVAEAASLRGSSWFLPYLPNPRLSASLEYDLEDSQLSWGFGVQFSVAILDRGERRSAALRRRETAELEELKLQAAVDTMRQRVADAWHALTLLELDREIAEIDLQIQEEETATAQSLYEAGFTGERAYVESQIDLERARLRFQRARHDYQIQRLRVAGYFGSRSNG